MEQSDVIDFNFHFNFDFQQNWLDLPMKIETAATTASH